MTVDGVTLNEPLRNVTLTGLGTIAIGAIWDCASNGNTQTATVIATLSAVLMPAAALSFQKLAPACMRGSGESIMRC